MTLAIAPGEMVAIMGPSVSGKSTLLNLMGGLDVPTSGRVIVAGRDLGRAGEEERSRFRRDHLAYVFQAYHLMPTLSAADNVALPLHLAGADPGQVREAIRRRIGGRMPALVSTRREFTAEIGRAIDSFYVLTQVTLLLALAVAFLGIVTSLLISVVERTREIGILKALGALPRQIRRGVAVEALAIAGASLALAVPLGALDARFMETTVAEAFSGWRMPHRFPAGILLPLGLGLPLVSLLAAWLPARAAGETRVGEAIVYE